MEGRDFINVSIVDFETALQYVPFHWTAGAGIEWEVYEVYNPYTGSYDEIGYTFYRL